MFITNQTFTSFNYSTFVPFIMVLIAYRKPVKTEATKPQTLIIPISLKIPGFLVNKMMKNKPTAYISLCYANLMSYGKFG